MHLARHYAKSVVTKITGTGIGERTRLFIHGAAWTLSGTVLARALSGGATLLAARCMGPAKFGEASLALAASLWIQVPMLAGIPTALLHYLPPVQNEDRPRWSAVGLGLMAVCYGFTLLLAFLFQGPLRTLLGVAPHVFKWTLFWCAGYTLYTACVSWISAEEKFSMRAAMETSFATLFLLCVLTSRFLRQATASNYMKSYCLAYVVVAVWGFISRKDRLAKPRDAKEIRFIAGRFISYGLIVSVGGVASALLLAPARLMANHYLNATEVGLLAVYQGGSIQIASILSAIGGQVFFPIASRTPNKIVLRQKMNQGILLSIAPALIILVVLLAVYFKLLGKNYPFELMNAGVYSLSAYLSFIFGIVSWYYAAMGRRGLLLQCSIGLMAGGINLLACWILIPRFHIVGAAWAYGLGATAGITALLALHRKLSIAL